MKLYYIFDTYCGWCYGFESVLRPFVKAHPELEVEVISGGLFGEGKPLSAYSYMPLVNQKITDVYGVTFGPGYQETLREGTMVPDSNDAAIGFGVLRELVPAGEQVEAAARMQEAFYRDGASLSDPETYRKIAASLGLDEETVVKRFRTRKAAGELHPDFAKARALGAESFPTLLLEKDVELRELGGKRTLETLEASFREAAGK